MAHRAAHPVAAPRCVAAAGTPAPRAGRRRGRRRADARSTRTGSSTVSPATRGGTPSTSGASLTGCRPASLSAAGTTSSCRPRSPTTRRCGAPAARPGSPSAPGPTRAPGSSPRRCATASPGSTQQLGERRGREPGRAVRVFVMGSRTVAGVLDVASGGGDPALVPRARGHAGARAAGRRARPTATATTRTTRRRPSAGRAELGTAGRKDQRRREHRHDVLTYTSAVLTRGPHGDRPADRHAVRALVARAHRLLRAAVRRRRRRASPTT